MKLTSTFCLLIATTAVVLLRTADAQQTRYSSPTEEIRAQMVGMEKEIRRVMAGGCSIQMNGIASYIQAVWWPHIQRLMASLPSEQQQKVVQKYSSMQAMLGLRKCPPNHTLYNGRCYPVGISNGGPCPRNQQLYDNVDNSGYCFCQQQNGNQQNPFLYVNGECYKQNEQGPCNSGEWLTVRNRTPKCERVPRGCPADGNHVYWKCGDGMTTCPRGRYANQTPKCSRLGSRQPTCGAGARLYRNGLQTVCGRARMADYQREPSVAMVLPARSPCAAAAAQQAQQRPAYYPPSGPGLVDSSDYFDLDSSDTSSNNQMVVPESPVVVPESPVFLPEIPDMVQENDEEPEQQPEPPSDSEGIPSIAIGNVRKCPWDQYRDRRGVCRPMFN